MLIIRSSVDISTIHSVKVNTERALPLASSSNYDSYELCGLGLVRSSGKQMTREDV